MVHLLAKTVLGRAGILPVAGCAVTISRQAATSSWQQPTTTLYHQIRVKTSEVQ